MIFASRSWPRSPSGSRRPARGYAQDKLKVAIPQRGFWDSSWVEFGQAAGFFKEAGLEIELFYTDGGAQTLTAAMSGSVDIALSNGFLGVIGAYVKNGAAGASVISAQMTGANELFWWVKADSPYKSLKDVPEGKTVAFSSPGSSSNLILLRCCGRPAPRPSRLAAGGAPASYHADDDRSGRCRLVGGAAGLAGRQPGQVQIIARAREATEMRNQTIRVNHRQRGIAQDQARGDHRSSCRFTRRRSTGPIRTRKRSRSFAEHEGAARLAKQGVDEYYPKSAMQLGEIKRSRALAEGCARLQVHPVAEDRRRISKGLFDIVYKPPG